MGDGPGGSHPGRSRRSEANTNAAIAEIKRRLDDGELHALVNNAAISPKAEGGKRLGSIDTTTRGLAAGVPGEFLRADHAGARPGRRAEGGQGLGGERHLDRRLARASVRRRGLRHLEGGARLADPRDGGRLRPRSASASTPSRRARSTPRSCRRAPRRSSSRSRCTGSARPTRWPRSSTCCAPRRASYVNGAEIHINGGQHVLKSLLRRGRPRTEGCKVPSSGPSGTSGRSDRRSNPSWSERGPCSAADPSCAPDRAAPSSRPPSD